MTSADHDDDSNRARHAPTRYVDRVVLRAVDGRIVSRATDRLSDRPILHKISPRDEVRREARALLEVPPEVAPRLLDLGELDAANAFLVTEWLEGRSLLEAPPAAERAAAIAASIAALVTRLHRAGWVHSDLKPANFVWTDSSCASLRLIDFGFSFRADQGPEEEEGRGGSPDYAAPELVRGWRLDARVDQFALGVTLRELFPALAADAACAAVFERMTAVLPSARFANMNEVTAALLHAMDRQAPSKVDLAPRLGGGPLRERGSLLARIEQALHAAPPEEARLLYLHGAPGAGVSRLLREVAYAFPDAQVLEIDTTRLGEATEARATAWIESSLAARKSVVVGVADPSPELRLLRATPRLRDTLLARSSTRLMIPRLSAAAFADCVAHALGQGRDSAEEQAAALHSASDGDLRLATEEFERVIGGASERSDTHPSLRAPVWDAVPADERITLAVVDRCGSAPDFAITQRAVRFVQGETALDAATAAGWIHRDESGRVAFTAENLRRGARALTLDEAPRLDAWLLDNLAPDPDRPIEVHESLERARRLGRREDEARLLRMALDRAVAQGTHSRYLQLFEPKPHRWTNDEVARHAREIASLLGDTWPEPRARHFLSRALHRAGDPIGVAHLEQVGRGEGEIALLARYEFLHALLNAGRREESAQLWTELERFLTANADTYPGLIELEHARQARGRGDLALAIDLAAQAETRLGPWLPVYAVDAVLLQASLELPAAPARAIELLERARRQEIPTDARVAVLMALAQVHELAGDFKSCAEVTEDALATSAVLHSERHYLRIAAQRAWAWAWLGRALDAEAEALRLLRDSEHRIEPSRLATLHLLLGFVALHKGEVRRSYNSILTAWEAVSGTASPMWRSVVLRSLADTCVDGEAWAVVPDAAVELGLGPKESPPSPAEARWHALVAQAAGRLEEAAAALRDSRAAIDRSSDRIEVGRYYHHLAIVELGRGQPGAQAAIEALDLALERFGQDGAGYFRSESLLARARAALLLGDREGSLRDLDQSVELARRLHCRRTLGTALRERTALLLLS